MKTNSLKQYTDQQFIELARAIINSEVDIVEGAVNMRNMLVEKLDIVEYDDFDIFILVDSRLDDFSKQDSKIYKLEKEKLGNFYKKDVIDGCHAVIKFVEGGGLSEF